MSALMRAMLYPYMDQAGADGAAGGGAGGGGSSSSADAGAAAAAAAAAASAAAGAGAGADGKGGAAAGADGKGGEPSLLSLGKTEADKDGTGAAAAKPEDKIPEKYRVYKGEGDAKAIDMEASTAKVIDAHASLEKRAGELGLPPEKHTDYKITLPEGSTLKAEDLEGPQLDAFKEAAHKSGMTQKQFDAAAAAHIQGLNDMVTSLAEKGATMAKDELAKDPDWQGANLTPQLKLAFKTFQAFATKEEAADIDRIGNNPVFLKVLARIGKDLGEDRLGKANGAAAVLNADSLSEYMKAGGPYWDATHADHKKYVDIVTRHHQAQYGTAAVPASRHG